VKRIAYRRAGSERSGFPKAAPRDWWKISDNRDEKRAKINFWQRQQWIVSRLTSKVVCWPDDHEFVMCE
jgi:hypothetical protein